MFGRTPETHPVDVAAPAEAAAAIDALPAPAIAVARAATPPPPPSVARPGQLPEPPKTVAVLTSGQILEREKEKGKIAAEIDKLKTRLEQL